MKYQIKNNENQLLAEIEVGESVFNVEYFDGEFKSFLENEIEKGIFATKDVFDKSSKAFVMSKQEVKKEEALFGFAVIELVRVNGFKVGEEEPKINQNVKSVLKEFSDDNEDKKELLNKLPSMTYLEKTLLLRELRKISSNS